MQKNYLAGIRTGSSIDISLITDWYMKRISRAVTLFIMCMMLYGFQITTGCISVQIAGRIPGS